MSPCLRGEALVWSRSKSGKRMTLCRIHQMEHGVKWFVATLMVCSLTVAAVAKPLQIEPTVSPKEAKLLSAAVATTNRIQAVAMLQTKGLPKASAALDFAIGNFQFQESQLEAAAQSYRNAIAKLPAFRNARKNLGRVYLLMDQDAKAIAVYQALVEEGIVDADSLLLLGHGLMRQARYVSAESAYRQVMLLAPDSAEAQQGLIRCLLQQERHHEARGLLKSVLNATPHRAEFWSLLANVNIALNATDDAVTALETARRLGLCDPSMLGLLGDLYLSAGQPNDAVASYEAALTAGWNDAPRLQRAIEGFIMAGDAASAARVLKQLESATAEPDADRVLEMLKLRGELAALEGLPADAIARYQELIVKDPLNGKAVLRLGTLLQETGDLGAAELAYERAGRLEGMQMDSLIKRAQLEVQRDRFVAAVRLLEAAEAIESRPHVSRYLEQVRRLAER